jgi:hypothetical protein
MGRKRNPVLPLFTRDIESSPKVNALSPEATGLYFRLLCRFNEPPRPGSLALHDWEVHSNWQRSLTQQCLSTTDKQRRLTYFAKFLSRTVLPWKVSLILKGLQELYFFGIIVVEDDMIIQPRMYKDNGFSLAEGSMTEAADELLKEGSQHGKINDSDKKDFQVQNMVPKSDGKSTEKSTEKKQFIHARAHSKEIEIENNNNINGNNKAKTAKFSPPTQEEVQEYCQAKGYTFDPIMFFNHYEANGWVQGKGKPIKSWKACCATWQQRETSGEFSGVRKSMSPTKQTVQSGDPVNATPTARGKYKNKW